MSTLWILDKLGMLLLWKYIEFMTATKDPIYSLAAIPDRLKAEPFPAGPLPPLSS